MTIVFINERLIEVDNTALFNGSDIKYNNATFIKYEDKYYVQCLLENDDYIKFTQDIPSDGYYYLEVEHSSKCDSFQSLLIDDKYYGGISFKNTNTNTSVTTKSFKLNKGNYSVSLIRNWGELVLHSMRLCEDKRGHKSHNPDFKLSNKNASKECISVMNYFKGIYGKRVITGQHNDFNCVDADYIERITGKLPALMGFDLMSYSAGTKTPEATWECMSEISYCKHNVDAAIYWSRERKALITLCWHWYSPSNGRDKSFYTVNSEYDLEKAMNEKNEDYRLLVEDIDLIAEQLKRLQNENIPVLWRPLHEADGRWFWWGANGAEAYIKLYRFMYDRYTNLHGLNNLIWVFNAPSEGWYPGDDVVDLNCMDIYGPKGNDGALCLEYEKGISIPTVDKPIGLGEVGTIPDLGQSINKAPWLWFMLWGGFTHDEQSNSKEALTRNFCSNNAVCLDEIEKIGLF